MTPPMPSKNDTRTEQPSVWYHVIQAFLIWSLLTFHGCQIDKLKARITTLERPGASK